MIAHNSKKTALCPACGKQQKPFTDNDLEGIVNAIIHAQETGYFRDDVEWAETMVNRISEMRKPK